MSDAKGNQEPSMEEILASIRRIISEDGEPKEEAATPAVNGHAAEEPEADDDDALVLTDMVVGDSNVVELQEEPAPTPVAPPPPAAAAPPPPPPPPAPPPAPEPEPELEALPEPEVAIPEDTAPDLELDTFEAAVPDTSSGAEMDDGLPVSPASPAPAVAASAAAVDPVADGDLVSPDVAAASAATMAQLVAKKPQLTQSRHASIDGLLVETLVRQAIEPMLKDWLDEHLQEIVERLVRREVERLSRKAELS